MRGSPSCLIAVRRFVVWRAAVAVVALASLALLVAWVLLTPAGRSVSARVMVSLATVSVAILSNALWRVCAVDLRWDGAGWSAQKLSSPTAAPIVGELEVAIDLGAFLLLRLTSRGIAGRRVRLWIPVERRGIEHEWHSFRCAVYSPRPAAGIAGAADARSH